MNETSALEQAMIDLFEQHVKAEMDGDIETTMATMTHAPHLNHVPTMQAAPVSGAEIAEKVLNPALPSREFF